MASCGHLWSGGSSPTVHLKQQFPVRAVEIGHRAPGVGWRYDRESCRFELLLPLQIDGSGGFAVAECQMRPELVGKRPHRMVLRPGGDAQAAVALQSRFID